MKRSRRPFSPQELRCPAQGCGRPKLAWQQLCPACFRRLPPRLAQMFRDAQTARAPHHLMTARMAAIDWLMRHPPGMGDGAVSVAALRRIGAMMPGDRDELAALLEGDRP